MSKGRTWSWPRVGRVIRIRIGLANMFRFRQNPYPYGWKIGTANTGAPILSAVDWSKFEYFWVNDTFFTAISLSYALRSYLVFILLLKKVVILPFSVLSGGSTMYPGLPSRLEREIKQLYLERVLKVSFLFTFIIFYCDNFAFYQKYQASRNVTTFLS